jgi:hypothetical protein
MQSKYDSSTEQHLILPMSFLDQAFLFFLLHIFAFLHLRTQVHFKTFMGTAGKLRGIYPSPPQYSTRLEGIFVRKNLQNWHRRAPKRRDYDR